MKYFLTFLLYFYYTLGFTQDLCHTDILNGEKVKNQTKRDLINYDFSALWTTTDNQFVYGIIGDDYQRLFIKLLRVTKSKADPNEYTVRGKSMVKGSIKEFIGTIIIVNIQETNRDQYGPDNELKNSGIKTQGLITAKYEFFEKTDEKDTGVYSGEVKSKWYLDKKGIKYDDMNSFSDSYFNNSFVGEWKAYHKEIDKKCNWGDYRIPNVHCDFDIGAGEFNVSEKYQMNGWWIKPKLNWWE